MIYIKKGFVEFSCNDFYAINSGDDYTVIESPDELEIGSTVYLSLDGTIYDNYQEEIDGSVQWKDLNKTQAIQVVRS